MTRHARTSRAPFKAETVWNAGLAGTGAAGEGQSLIVGHRGPAHSPRRRSPIPFDDHLPPGEGIIDWWHVRETLLRVGFDGWIVLELACPTGPMAACFSDALHRVQELFG